MQSVTVNWLTKIYRDAGTVQQCCKTQGLAPTQVCDGGTLGQMPEQFGKERADPPRRQLTDDGLVSK